MNLFASAGVDLPPAGGRRAAARARGLRTPLFNYRVVEEARQRLAFAPSSAQAKAASDYAKLTRSARFASNKETKVRPVFIQRVLVDFLGWRPLEAEGNASLAHEYPLRAGMADIALGRFGPTREDDAVLAPFEVKGPATEDLDAVMPGRGKSPVQQAWEYAIDAPGARWVLVSNCLEIRLYGFGRGRDAYEIFDLTLLDQEDEQARLWLMLSAERMLGGETDRLLRETDSAYATVGAALYADYKGLRDKLIHFLRDSADGPALSWLQAIEGAQKILDRILFIAFAERTDLLPDRLLNAASTANNKFAPVPLWQNFRNLFAFVDRGRPSMAIPAYNGGLFAADPLLDDVMIPDPLAGELAALGDWDYRNEVPVTVLGRLFEQSVTDIEALKAEAVGREPPKTGKRKRDGIVYTPDMITRFLVDKTIGVTLKERFEALWRAHGMAPDASEPREIGFWQAYLADLRDLTIVDPACGSGAFLVAAYDALALEYRLACARLEALGAPAPFDWIDEIVTRNLHGVDLNAESVEITRLSLWLKTARRHHRLHNLEATIQVGDSLIEDGAFSDRPFDWQAAFPAVFARGGFDIVIGNPPYVRMELIKAIKPYLQKHYVVAHGQADLYAYFFERGVKLLKQGGRLGFVSSSTFFRTGSGEKLRAFLGDGLAIETIVDFGDLQLFEGVTTYPAIVTLRRSADAAGELSYLSLADAVPADLGRTFAETARAMPRSRLGSGAWRLEGDDLAALRAKIAAGRPTLGEVYGPPLRGIVTGLNEAFVIDRATRDRLVLADPRSAELIQPFLRGENIKRWRVESEDLWLINASFGLTRSLDSTLDTKSVGAGREAAAWSTFSAHYPAIAGYLLSFQDPARIRTDQGQFWWELRACTYLDKFSAPKMLYPEISQGRKFTLEKEFRYISNKCFCLRYDINLLGFLNSRLFWFWITGETSPLRGGEWRYELREQNMSQAPIDPRLSSSDAIGRLAQTCTDAARARFEEQTRVRRRIRDLAAGTSRKPSGRLNDFWTLDFPDFLAEAKKSLGVTIKLKQQGEWEEFLAEAGAKINRLTAAIEAAEREIDAKVYALFDLTNAEIALIEAAVTQKR